MRNNRTLTGVFGVLLLAAGALLLLQNLGIFVPILSNTIWAPLFGLGGLAFLLVFITNREQWWALIPGLTLLGLAVLVGFGERLGELGAAIFMAFIGLSFILIYALHPEFWWAIIPAGSLFSVAGLIALSGRIKGEAAIGIMFLGLALTFASVYLLPGRAEERRWALIPAGILAAIGVFMMPTWGGMINYLWAIALIAVGMWILFRALRTLR
jgi:hypothetical protein